MIEQTTFYLSVGRPVYAELLDGRMLAGRLELHDQQNVMIGTEEVCLESIVDVRVMAALGVYHAAHEAGDLVLLDGMVVPFTKSDLESAERDFKYIKLSNYDCRISGHLDLMRDEPDSDVRLALRDLRVESAVLSLNCSELGKKNWLYKIADRDLLLPARLQSSGANGAVLVDDRGTSVRLQRADVCGILHLPLPGERISLSNEARVTEGIVLSLNETLQDGVSYLASANLLLDDGTVCTTPLTKATSLLWKGKVVASAQNGKSVDLCESSRSRFDFSTESMSENTGYDYVREHSAVWCELSVSRRKAIAVKVHQEQEIFTGYGIIIIQPTGDDNVGFIGTEFMTRNYAAILHRSLPRGSVAFRKSTIKEELTSGIVAVVRYNTTIDPDTVPEGEPVPMATTVTVVEKIKPEQYSRFLVGSNGRVSKTVLDSEMVSLSLMNMEDGSDTEAGTAGILKLVGEPAQSAQLLSCNLMTNAAVFRFENGETRTLSGKELEWFRTFGRVSHYRNGYGYVNGNYFFHINDCDKEVGQCLNFLAEGQKPLLSYALAVRWKNREAVVNAVDVHMVSRDVRKGWLVLFRPDEAVVELDSTEFDPEAAFHLPLRKKLMPCDVALVEDLNFYNNDRSKRLTYPVEYWLVEENGMSMVHLADAPEKAVEEPLLGYLSWGIPQRYSFIYRPEQMDWDKGEAYEDEKKNGLYLPLENQDVSLSFERGTQYAVTYTVSTSAFGKTFPRVNRVLWQGRLSELAPKPELPKPKRPVQAVERVESGTEDLSDVYARNEGERFGILIYRNRTGGTIAFHYEQGYQAPDERLPILYTANNVRFTYDSRYTEANDKLNIKDYAYLVCCTPEGTTVHAKTGKVHPTLQKNSEIRVLRRYSHRSVKALDVKGNSLTVEAVEQEDPGRKFLSEMPLPIPGESLLLEQMQDGKESAYRLCTTDGETLFASDDQEELGSVTDNLAQLWRFGCITDYTAGNEAGTINGKYRFSAADMESKLQRIADCRVGGWWQLGLLCVFRMDRTQKIVAVARARDCRTFLPWEKALVREVLPQKSRIVVEAERDQSMICFRNTDNPDDQYISAAMKRENGLKDDTVWVRCASMCWWDDDAAKAQLRSEVFEMRAEEQRATIRSQYLEDGKGGYKSTYVAEYQTTRYALSRPEFQAYLDKECHVRWLRSEEDPTRLDAQLLDETLQKNCDVDSPYAAAVDNTLTGGSPIYQDRPERKELWKCLTRQTEDENREFVPGRCAVVWGTRRAGKTTMMNQIVQQIMNDKRLSSRTIVVSIGSFLGDVGGEPALESGRWERNLFKWILRGINKAARASAELADFLDNNGLNTELSWSEDVRTDFSDFMERFNECNTGKHPYRIVLIIDEFTGFANTLYLKFQAAKNEGNLERANSWKRQMDFIRFLSERGVVQILVGHDTMMQAMEKLDAVNLNIQSAEKIQVSSLPPDAARELIRAPMKKAFGLDPYDSASGQRVVEQIQDLTGCFPDLLIKLCNKMAEFYKASGPEHLRIQESDLKNVVRQYINNQNEQLSWKSFDYLTEDDGDNLRGDNGADTSICLKTLAETTVKGHPDARTVPTKIANKVLFDKMGQKAAEEAMDKLNRRDILRWVTGKDGVSNVKITFGLYLEVTKNMLGEIANV